MRWVDVFLARFKGPEVDACLPSGPTASSNRGCKIQLCETRRAQTLEHGAEKYRIQVTSNVVPSSGCRQHWEALLTSEKFVPWLSFNTGNPVFFSAMLQSLVASGRAKLYFTASIRRGGRTRGATSIHLRPLKARQKNLHPMHLPFRDADRHGPRARHFSSPMRLQSGRRMPTQLERLTTSRRRVPTQRGA